MNSALPLIAITGWGMTTPLGNSAQQTWDALLAGKAIGHHSPALLPIENTMDRVTQLGAHAASEAMAMSGWRDAALVVGTSKGPIENWLRDTRCLCCGDGFGLGVTASRIAGQLRLSDGPRLVVSAACASGLHALIRGAMLLERGEADRVLVVAVESSLHPLFIGCFQRLGVLPPEGMGCRPFDVGRRGFLISEAVAAVCLERENRSDGGICVDRYAMGAAGGHLTTGDPDGAALRYLLRRVIDGGGVDLIHAHGTGTVAHDPVELAAVEECVGDARPLVYSHKGALGHSLGAAGLISVVLNCIMHRSGCVPGNVNTTEPLGTNHVRIWREVEQRAVKRSIASASGFGGPTAVVAVRSF